MKSACQVRQLPHVKRAAGRLPRPPAQPKAEFADLDRVRQQVHATQIVPQGRLYYGGLIGTPLAKGVQVRHQFIGREQEIAAAGGGIEQPHPLKGFAEGRGQALVLGTSDQHGEESPDVEVAA